MQCISRQFQEKFLTSEKYLTNRGNHLFSKSGISLDTLATSEKLLRAHLATCINKQKYGGATCKFISSDFPTLC
jgi:hypothetical protein